MFAGHIRLGGIARRQFSSFFADGYQSAAINADFNLPYSIGKYNWISAGLMTFYDKVGSLEAGNRAGYFSLAFHRSNNAKHDRVISVGLQYGKANFSLNPDRAIFRETSELTALNDFKRSYNDLNLGVNYYMKLKNKSNLLVGVAAQHLFFTDFMGIDSTRTAVNDVYSRINMNVNYDMFLSDKVRLEPALYFSKMGNNYNINLQTLSTISLSDKNSKAPIAFKVGLGYRIQDALEILAGFQYHGWNFDLAYDVTMSSARVYNNYDGAIELSASKIINIPHKPKIKPIIICPRL
jgi:type IX secretion system PorP/SprF family membrane protein